MKNVKINNYLFSTKRIMFNVPMWLFAVLLLFGAVNSEAYNNTETHPLMTEVALDNSQLKKVFNENFAVKDITTQVFSYTKDKETIYGSSVIQLLKDGSDWEDVPICRASNHFHNPLEAWDKAHRGESI